MITTLITIIAILIILGVVWWGIQTLLPMVPLPEPFRTVINVLLVIVAVVIVVYIILQLLGVVTGELPRLH